MYSSRRTAAGKCAALPTARAERRWTSIRADHSRRAALGHVNSKFALAPSNWAVAHDNSRESRCSQRSLPISAMAAAITGECHRCRARHGYPPTGLQFRVQGGSAHDDT
jgi:hypothetical protein